MVTFSFNSIPDCICVYMISNTKNEKVYIGSTTCLSKRIIQHRYDSIKRSNNCPKLYKAITEIGANNFNVSIIEEFTFINMTLLHNKEVEYMNKYNSIENGYNERQDVDAKCITSVNTKTKMSNSGKNAWSNGIHKDHARKLSKFQYNVYDGFTNELLEEDMLIKDIEKKYNIHASNIFQGIQKQQIRNNGVYDETITVKYKTKNIIIERIYIGGTTRGNYKDNKSLPPMTFSF